LRALSVLNISPTSRNLSIPTSLPHTRSNQFYRLPHCVTAPPHVVYPSTCLGT
jgi:hypothetical protein